MLRPPKTRLTGAALAGLLAAGLVGIVGYGSPGTATPQASRTVLPVALWRTAPTPLPTIGQPAPERSPKAPVTLNSLHRSSSGFTTLTLTISNDGYPQMPVPAEWNGDYTYAGGAVSAITLTDEAHKVRYNPLRIDPDQLCVCTDAGELTPMIGKGESYVIYATFKLSPGTSSVTVNLPDFTAAKDIPVK